MIVKASRRGDSVLYETYIITLAYTTVNNKRKTQRVDDQQNQWSCSGSPLFLWLFLMIAVHMNLGIWNIDFQMSSETLGQRSSRGVSDYYIFIQFYF